MGTPSSPPRASSRCLFWCMLSRGQDYAHQQPSLTAQKLRRLELRAGAPTRKGKNTGLSGHPPADAPGRAQARPPGRGLLRAHDRDWQAAASEEEGGRERDTGARIDQGPRRASRAADHKPLTSALRHVIDSRPTQPNAASPTSTTSTTTPPRKYRPQQAARARAGANRAHRSRSKALARPSATDPSSEPGQNSAQSASPSP